ncbi:MAG: DegT/DnrJ/EryC1/StrS family aminotransferase [Pyrinomonadaceae bacterium]
MKVPLLDLKEQNQELRPAIEAAIGKVLDSNGYILGGEVEALEKELADYCRTKFAVGCASGTDALMLALMAFDIGRGDEVITTPYSFFASTSAITRLGATPVFVDIEPHTFNINVNQVKKKIRRRTKAILPVDLYGQCAEMHRLLEVGREEEEHSIPVIEDAAQAIGAEETGQRAGSISEIGCFSFYPSKNLGGMGDGGFLTTNDEELAKKLFALRVHGSFERYYHKWVGLNSRLDAMQAAILRVKLPHLDSWSDKRYENAQRYRTFLFDAGLTEQIILPLERDDVRHIYNQFVIRVPEKRDALKKFLAENEIGTDIYYPVPLHLQECFAYLGYKEGDFPEAERAARETLALPIYPELTDAQQSFVVEKIIKFFGEK